MIASGDGTTECWSDGKSQYSMTPPLRSLPRSRNPARGFKPFPVSIQRLSKCESGLPAWGDAAQVLEEEALEEMFKLCSLRRA
jgi:hypothetical protein